MIYVDTSLLLPSYVPETQSATANAVLKTASSVIVSDLTVAEFLVGLARKVKLGEISSGRADEARALFEMHLTEGLLRRTALLPAHAEEAGKLASQSPVILRTLDALHLAVLAGLGTRIATFDGRLSEAARALGYEVLP